MVEITPQHLLGAVFQMTDMTKGVPIFVLAYMHSGTTLLQQIMGRNSAVFVSGGETRHFSNLSVTRQKFQDLSNDTTLRAYVIYLISVICSGYATVNFNEADQDGLAYLEKFDILEDDVERVVLNAEEKRDYNQLYLLVFDYLTERSGKSRWLDKLPGYVAQFEQIRDAVPQAKFIELVRDTRDILASKKKRSSRGGGYDPLWDSLAWQSAVRAGNLARARYPDQVLRVKYEDLVTTPEDELSRICAFLDLTYESSMLSVGWINTTSADRASDSQGISTAAVGKWKDQLSTGDVAVCQMVAGKELENTGYPLMPVSWKAFILIPVIIGKSGIEFFTRLFNRWRQGGFHYLFNVLSNYRLRFQRKSVIDKRAP